MFCGTNLIFQNHLQEQQTSYHVKHLGVTFDRNVEYRNNAEEI
jgi:hypothetical protein